MPGNDKEKSPDLFAKARQAVSDNPGVVTAVIGLGFVASSVFSRRARFSSNLRSRAAYNKQAYQFTHMVLNANSDNPTVVLGPALRTQMSRPELVSITPADFDNVTQVATSTLSRVDVPINTMDIIFEQSMGTEPNLSAAVGSTYRLIDKTHDVSLIISNDFLMSISKPAINLLKHQLLHEMGHVKYSDADTGLVLSHLALTPIIYGAASLAENFPLASLTVLGGLFARSAILANWERRIERRADKFAFEHSTDDELDAAKAMLQHHALAEAKSDWIREQAPSSSVYRFFSNVVGNLLKSHPSPKERVKAIEAEQATRSSTPQI
jgi:hypothetical protein